MRGRLFWFAGDPERDGPPIQVSDDVVVCLDGQIVASGPWTELHRRIPADTVVHRYPDHLVTAGFVDAYTHYPRTNVVARHADWLDRHVYLEEARFACPSTLPPPLRYSATSCCATEPPPHSCSAPATRRRSTRSSRLRRTPTCASWRARS